jgi:predicted metalloprotease with PDZ domain
MRLFSLVRAALAAGSILQVPVAVAQVASAPISNVRYDIVADSVGLANRSLGVTTSFDVADNGAVLLSLPAWTPGAYEISNFARWVSNFAPTQNGVPLKWDKVDYDTWRVRPTRAGRVSIAFRYEADTLDNAMAWSKPDFVLFNGTNLFMYPEGRALDFPATVTVKTEAAWRVATSMPPAGAARSYTSQNYHDLVDMPFFVGVFDLDSATISGKQVRFASYPRGSIAAEGRRAVLEQLRRIIPVEANVFGGVPWDSYSLLQIVDSTAQGYSGLEHASSHVDIVVPQFVGSDGQPSLYAHEIFHAWNVKRLRPAELFPYRYDRPQPTPWLWVSEGITDYYADLTEVRSGLVDAAGFYALTAEKMNEIAATTPFALEDASLNTWVHPADGTGYSYYPKGSLAGFMLDIIIRDASDNKNSLDSVMRELYETTYAKGRGFMREDFWGAVSRAAHGRSFDDFEEKYVNGRDAYPWALMLPLAGLRIVPDSAPRIGITTLSDPTTNAIRVTELEPAGAAQAAGVKVGDVLVSIGDIPVNDGSFAARFRVKFAGRAAGTPVPITVKRGEQTLNLQGVLKYAQTAARLTEDPKASAKAVRIRTGILTGITSK